MEIAINKAYVIRFITLLGLLIIIPLFHYQPITGPIVNAILFLSLYYLKQRDALVLAVFPSLVALMSGLLPPQAITIIPYIIISNFVLIITFNYLRKNNYWVGIIVSSLAKFLFLFLASNVLLKIFFANKISIALANMMSIPQFITAVIGGVIAYFVLKKYGQESY